MKKHVEEEEEEKKGKGKGKRGKGEKGKGPKKQTSVMEERDVVYVRDVSAFVQFVIKERGLDPKKTTVRVGLDGGQDTFKVVASIFDAEAEKPDEDGDEDGSAESAKSGKLDSG